MTETTQIHQAWNEVTQVQLPLDGVVLASDRHAELVIHANPTMQALIDAVHVEAYPARGVIANGGVTNDTAPLFQGALTNGETLVGYRNNAKVRERRKRHGHAQLQMKTKLRILSCATLIAGFNAANAQSAQAVNPPATNLPSDGWQQCQQMTHDIVRLVCFDRWAQQQTSPATVTPPSALPQSDVTAATPTAPVTQDTTVVTSGGCRDPQYDSVSRFWELESRTSCGRFNLRGYRPLNISMSVANRRPVAAPYPPVVRNGVPQYYQAKDLRLNLSLRMKIGQDMLTGNDPTKKDSLWLAYTQQSSWQVFNGALSRPFRSTDHEPELIYVYPIDFGLAGGWRMRYGGLGLNHQSNGQSMPLSLGWNRAYLMAGADLNDRYIIDARVWQRIAKKNATDVNPIGGTAGNIEDYIGRAEIKGTWNFDRNNQFAATLRNNLRASGKGSIRFEWLRAIGNPAPSNLRFHVQLFHGYGDSLLDYNVKRTVFMVGFSLVDF